MGDMYCRSFEWDCPMNATSPTQLERARSALKNLDPECPRLEWIKIGMACMDAGLDFDDWHEWSEEAEITQANPIA